MSRPDVLAELRDARPTAPQELRARVRLIATVEQPSRRRLPALTWRRATALLAPAALGLAAVAIVLGRGGSPTQPERTAVAGGAGAPATKSAPFSTQSGAGALDESVAPAPARTRLQDYDATLSLRVRNAGALSDATKRAVAIARSLGGFAASVHVDVQGGTGDATLRLRVPVTHVQEAVQRLSELGTITGEAVNVQDVQAGVDALDRRIARLQRQLRELRAQPRTPAIERRIATLTAQVQRLQRSRASTVRTARLATVSVQMTTRTAATPPRPAHHGRLDGVVSALTWLGIGALYALAVGGPVVVLAVAIWLGWRVLRRRGERRLLDL